MYCTNIHLYGSKQYPLMLGAIYEGIAETYTLPSLETLQRSIKSDVIWPKRNGPLQVGYIDPLTPEPEEYQEKDVLQVRFDSSREAKELVTIFLSIQQSQVKNITVDFPGRTGRGAFSRILAVIKSVLHTQNINLRDFQFEAQGFRETGVNGYIKEHSLTAFVWINSIERYLHIREDPSDLEEVRRGRRNL